MYPIIFANSGCESCWTGETRSKSHSGRYYGWPRFDISSVINRTNFRYCSNSILSWKYTSHNGISAPLDRCVPIIPGPTFLTWREKTVLSFDGATSEYVQDFTINPDTGAVTTDFSNFPTAGEIRLDSPNNYSSNGGPGGELVMQCKYATFNQSTFPREPIWGMGYESFELDLPSGFHITNIFTGNHYFSPTDGYPGDMICSISENKIEWGFSATVPLTRGCRINIYGDPEYPIYTILSTKITVSQSIELTGSVSGKVSELLSVFNAKPLVITPWKNRTPSQIAMTGWPDGKFSFGDISADASWKYGSVKVNVPHTWETKKNGISTGSGTFIEKCKSATYSANDFVQITLQPLPT